MFICLNLNGSPLFCTERVLTELNFAGTIRTFRPCAFLKNTSRGHRLESNPLLPTDVPTSLTDYDVDPSLITMLIGATRMYRSLSDFVSGTTDMYDFLPSSLPPRPTDDDSTAHMTISTKITAKFRHQGGANPNR